jgi:putative hydrolase of the HAD superfamily
VAPDHLLLDCDGVLQQVGGDGWRSEIRRRLGERTDDFVRAVDDLEAPALRGEADFPDGLEEVLARFGVDLDAAELYAALWESIRVLPVAWGVAEEAASSGVRVHLATNQHPRRAELMRRTLGYERITEHAFYSCELGVAKPDPAFFEAVVGRLGSRPGRVAFVDDSRRNVEVAQALGLRAVHWHLDEGEAVLRARLREVGVSLAAPARPDRG